MKGTFTHPATSPTPQSTPVFVMFDQLDPPVDINGVYGSASDDELTNGYAVGDYCTSPNPTVTGCTIYQYEPEFETWQRESDLNGLATENLNDIWCNTSYQQIVIVGDNGAIVQKPGSQFNFQRIDIDNFTADLYSVSANKAYNVFAVGSSGSILKYDLSKFDEDNSEDPSTWHVFSSEQDSGIDLFGVMPQFSGRNVWAVGNYTDPTPVSHGLVKQYLGGERHLNDYHRYWDRFFKYIREYADSHAGLPWTGQEVVSWMSHCTAESFMDEPPLSAYSGSCPGEGRGESVQINSVLEPADMSVLDYGDDNLVFESGAGIRVQSGQVTVRTLGTIWMEQGSFLDVSGTSGSSGGTLYIETGRRFTILGEVTADSGTQLSAGNSPVSGGSIYITAERVIISENGRISAKGLGPGSPGGNIEITAKHLANWGEITADSDGAKSGSIYPIAGSISIDTVNGGLCNLGLISSSNLNGDDGHGGNIGIVCDKWFTSSGLIESSSYGEKGSGSEVPEAGEVLIIAGMDLENSGQIHAASWIGANGKGGEVSIVVEGGDLLQAGPLSADSFGDQTGEGDYPMGGTVILATDQTLSMKGNVSADARSWSDPRGDGEIRLYYNNYE